MSLNPLNELKRRLEDDATPLPKRLCLAKNVVTSHHFPAASKERVVAEWLETLSKGNQLQGKVLQDVVGWLRMMDDTTGVLKRGLIQVVSQYIERNPLQEDNVEYILSFLENKKISTQLTTQIKDYLHIVITLLQHLKNDESIDNTALCQRIFNNLIGYYKECKKKLEFIIKFLDGEILETIFSFLDTECCVMVVNVCQNVLFPMNKKSFFVSFLQTLIRKDNIDELIAEKGDNIQSVLKIMSAFFTFPKGRSGKDPQFLSAFTEVFVSCFRNESQLIFAFYIMVVNSLNMPQSYINPAMVMPPITFEENDAKIKRNLFLKMLEILLKNEVDISVRLTDTFGENISKVEIKKTFTLFLQTVMLKQLKLEGRVDKNTLHIIKTALKLDPVLIEQKMDQILPPIMTAKKYNPTIMECYIEMLNCLLEILFKLSRGAQFMNQILPHVKLNLEALNTEQFKLNQMIKEATDQGTDCEKLKIKLITGNDVFPKECAEMFGKWTSDLMFRQNKELLLSLQKDLDVHCLMMLEEEFVSPSIITLAEVLSTILSSFLRHNKMADHTVGRQVAEDFWSCYQAFEDECLRKFGECVLKLSYNPSLTKSFLQLCQNFSQLKLLNMKYSNTKLDTPVCVPTLVHDLSVVLPCLRSEQWMVLAERVGEDESVVMLDNLLLIKMMAIQLLTSKHSDHNQNVQSTQTHLIKKLTSKPDILATTYLTKVLFSNLDKTQLRQLAKTLVRLYLSDLDSEVIRSDAVVNNRALVEVIVLETCKNVCKCFENTEDLTKKFNKTEFELDSFVKDAVDMKEYFNQINMKEGEEETILNCMELLTQLPLPYLAESLQLISIFMMLLTKKCCQTRKTRKCIDHLLQCLYELSPKSPDLYQMFPVEFIFCFEEKTMINLLTLKIKTSNNLLVIKCVLEIAVKKVKTDSDVVKNIVEILLTNRTNKKCDTSNIEYFSDPVFQICCIILPIITKQKKVITTSAYRSILANLQDRLNKSMLESFKNMDFSSNFANDTSGNTDDSVAVSDNTLVILNAMAAYSLTLSRYCETNDVEENKNLDGLLSGLEFFVQNAVNSIQNPSTKHQHVESSIQLLNTSLRYLKKLHTHPIFEDRDKILLQIWKSIVSRLLTMFGKHARRDEGCLEDIAVVLKFICELTSVECFVNGVVGDLSKLCELKKPQILKIEDGPSEITSHKVSKYLWTQCLNANIVGPKCVALSKSLYRTTKTLRFWIQQHYENQDGVFIKKEKERTIEETDSVQIEERVTNVIKVDDNVCEVLRIDLDLISVAIFAAKKISLDYKSMDSIFELQHMIHYIMGRNTAQLRCEVTWRSFFSLFEGSMAVLNSLLVSRAELLEDRWPCYMQCYRTLVGCLCLRGSEPQARDKLAESAYSVEKLTQSICKRKTQVSRIAAYTVADICALLEQNPVERIVRQHLENSVAFLIQASDSSYSVSFLRRALAGSPGHMTMTYLYTMYKRYHKYVGNA